ARVASGGAICWGSDLTLDASASSDPNEACGDGVRRLQWDFDGDGVYERTSPGGVAHTFLWDSLADLGGGPHTVSVRAVDTFGNVGPPATTSFTLTTPSAGGHVVCLGHDFLLDAGSND